MKPARQQEREANQAAMEQRPRSVLEWRYVEDELPEEGVCVLLAPHWEPGVWNGEEWHEPASSLRETRRIYRPYAWAPWPSPPPRRG